MAILFTFLNFFLYLISSVLCYVMLWFCDDPIKPLRRHPSSQGPGVWRAWRLRRQQRRDKLLHPISASLPWAAHLSQQHLYLQQWRLCSHDSGGCSERVSGCSGCLLCVVICSGCPCLLVSLSGAPETHKTIGVEGKVEWYQSIQGVVLESLCWCLCLSRGSYIIGSFGSVQSDTGQKKKEQGERR